MPPRQHQLRNLDIATRIASGEQQYKTVINVVTTGGGKSAIPRIYASVLIPDMADKICWVVPKDSLRLQGEIAFSEQWLNEWLANRRTIRAACNEQHPARNTDGYITTYQAIDANPDVHRHEFSRYRYVLVLDEPHHIADGQSWHRAITPLVDRAALVVLMTGTLERGDGGRIAFIDYRPNDNGKPEPDIATTTDRALVTYTRGDALGEQPTPAIVPITFFHVDMAGEWVDRSGSKRTIDSFLDVSEDDAPEAIFTSLNTEYAHELLHRCVTDWTAYRVHHPASQLLIVAYRQSEAKRYQESLRGRARIGIAVSDEGAAAQSAIKAFRERRLDVLVTVGMAYEGLDPPGVSHIACLTAIRSRPWIEQMLGRGVRRDDGALGLPKTQCYAYVPDDPLMRDVIERIRVEQAPYVRQQLDTRPPGGNNVDIVWTPPVEIIPLSGSISGIRVSELDGVEELDDASIMHWEQIIASQGLTGRLTPIQAYKVFRAALDNDPRPFQQKQHNRTTESETENTLRSAIQRTCNIVDFKWNRTPGSTNGEVVRRFGKSRTLMSSDDLQRAWAYLTATYPDAVQRL